MVHKYFNTETVSKQSIKAGKVPSTLMKQVLVRRTYLKYNMTSNFFSLSAGSIKSLRGRNPPKRDSPKVNPGSYSMKCTKLF